MILSFGDGELTEGDTQLTANPRPQRREHAEFCK